MASAEDLTVRMPLAKIALSQRINRITEGVQHPARMNRRASGEGLVGAEDVALLEASGVEVDGESIGARFRAMRRAIWSSRLTRVKVSCTVCRWWTPMCITVCRQCRRLTTCLLHMVPTDMRLAIQYLLHRLSRSLLRLCWRRRRLPWILGAVISLGSSSTI